MFFILENVGKIKKTLKNVKNVTRIKNVFYIYALQRLTNENVKFGSILYPIGKYSGNILDTPGTFVLH